MIGDKLIYQHVWIQNVWEKFPKNQSRVLDKEPKVGVQDFPRQPTNGMQLTPSGSIDAPLVVHSLLEICVGREETNVESLNQSMEG